jgi:hypothetical protein
MVPPQRRHAVARLYAQPLQRIRELEHAAVDVSIGRPVQRLVRSPRDHFRLAEELAHPPEHVRQREREIHHECVHAAKD